MSRPERTFRTETIILSRIDFGEADRLLTLFTPKHGKLRAIAKGARKPTTRKSGHVELYAKVDMLLHRGRDLFIISQADMTESYLPLREDLRRTAYASYIAELLNRFSSDEEEDEAGQLFALLDATLMEICGDIDLRLIARYFEMRLMDVVGFRPELNTCVINGETITRQNQFFSPQEGGVVCPDCAMLRDQIIPIDVQVLHALRILQREPWATVRALALPDTLHTAIERVMLGYLVALLESRLQSVDFIRRLK